MCTVATRGVLSARTDRAAHSCVRRVMSCAAPLFARTSGRDARKPYDMICLCRPMCDGDRQKFRQKSSTTIMNVCVCVSEKKLSCVKNHEFAHSKTNNRFDRSSRVRFETVDLKQRKNLET